MDDILMTLPMKENEQDIDLESYAEQEAVDDMAGDIDMAEYADSPEDQSATWWDVAKDVVVQPGLGLAAAFTWPADVLKIGMVGEALSDVDELEEAFKKEGKEFNKSEYLKNVAETSEFIPTQKLLEDYASNKLGF